jgi:hypothetical protein
MSETERLPAGTTVYHCPLSLCTWTHAELPISEEELAASLDCPVLDVALRRALAVENEVAAHLSSHTLLEWVTEIMRLRRVADAAAEWDAFLSASAAMSYVLDARELERREREAERALRDAVAESSAPKPGRESPRR